MKCIKCNFENRTEADYCEECGAKLEIQCPECGTLIPLGRKYCGKCGSTLVATAKSSPPEFDSERKHVTVLFTDLSGYTTIAERLDPEKVKAITEAIFKTVSKIIYRYEGYIERVIGDEVMALFGYPLAHEDDPIRAIKAAIDIHSAVVHHSNQIRNKIGSSLSMHTGINTGLVVTGKTRIDQGQDGFAGDTINVAARLTKMASPDEILVGAQTHKLCKDWFEFQSLGPTNLKGKLISTDIYKVKGERNRSRGRSGREVGAEIVGRDDAMAQLLHQVTKTINGSGAIVNIVGEAGIGKSRLIAELKKQDLIHRVTLLEGRAISIGQSLSFYPVIDFLKTWIGISEEDRENEAFKKLEGHVRRILSTEADEALAFLATLLGMKLFGRYKKIIEQIEDESLDKLIFKNSRDFLAEAAEKKPLVIVMEDFHWADQSTIEFMAYLFRLAGTHKVLFINVFRPDYSETSNFILNIVQNDYPDLYINIPLNPLDDHFSEVLINRILGGLQGFHDVIIDEIIKRAGGNPLFIEEVLRSLIDDGVITASNGGFKINDKIESVTIPSGIQDVLISRIDKLDETTRSLVKMASVIGRNFFYKIIAEVADSIEKIDERLSYLKGIQFIRERTRMEELEYLFKHALVQEAAYSTILHKRREILHKKVARSIENVFSEKLHEFYGMLAYHYSQGGDLERAEKYMIQAGEQALKSSASSEALQLYQQALKIYTDRKGKEVDLKKVNMLEKNIGLALFNRGRHTEAVEYFDRVISFNGLKNYNNAILRTSKFLICLMKLVIRLYLPIGRPKMKMPHDEAELRNLVLKRGTSLSQTDPERCFMDLFFGLDRVWRYDLADLDYGYAAMYGAGALFSYTGLSFTLSRKLMEFGKDKYDKDDKRARLMSKFAEIITFYSEGSWGSIKDYDPELVESNLKTGEIFVSTSYVYFYGLFNLDRGNFDAVERLIDRIHQIAADFDNVNCSAFMHEVKLKYLLKTLKFEETRVETGKAIESAKKVDLKQYLYLFYAYKARMQAMQGDLEGAGDALLIAKEYYPEVKGLPCYIVQYLISWFYTDLCRLEKLKRQKEVGVFSETQKRMKRTGKRMLAQSRKYMAERIQALRLVGSYHWFKGRQAKAMSHWEQSMKLAERLNARLELSRTYFEIGKRLLEKQSKFKELNGVGAAGYLQKAETLFQEMHLQSDLDELLRIDRQVGI